MDVRTKVPQVKQIIKVQRSRKKQEKGESRKDKAKAKRPKIKGKDKRQLK